MRDCLMEECAHWPGHGCACELLDLVPEPVNDQDYDPHFDVDYEWGE